jgi:hypothetical protein
MAVAAQYSLSLIDGLERLADLRANGALTDSEFAEAKARLLAVAGGASAVEHGGVGTPAPREGTRFGSTFPGTPNQQRPTSREPNAPAMATVAANRSDGTQPETAAPVESQRRLLEMEELIQELIQ